MNDTMIVKLRDQLHSDCSESDRDPSTLDVY